MTRRKAPYHNLSGEPMTASEKPDPYEQGMDAAHTNKSQADCPYDFSTPEGQQWVQGYQDGGGTD